MSASSSLTRPRAVSSNQDGPHPRLAAVLARHRATRFARPLPAHAEAALKRLFTAIEAHHGALILDSGCGTGESTLAIARNHPAALVIGVDKSARRLERARARPAPPSNALFLRLDLVDCWLEFERRGWPLAAHYLLYPNPWPKQHQLLRRWHAHPLMPTLLALGGKLELRTNWRIYAEEFAISVGALGGPASEVELWQPNEPISAFERKYSAAGLALYRVRARLPTGSRHIA